MREHCERIAAVKRRAFRDWEYWGKPVPSFGDPQARILILGLAPGAHGSNRTGRMFTGDRSGDWLYRALHQTGFASQPASVSRHDGLALRDVYITAAARCAPPGNKPAPEELRNCRPYLERELDLLTNVKVVVALGKIAFDTYLDVLKVARRHPQPRALRLRPQPPVHHRARAPAADRLLSPQPAEHLHRQADGEDAARRVPRALQTDYADDRVIIAITSRVSR